MLPPSARLPDALVGLVPVRAHPLDDAGQVAPRVVVDRPSVLVEEVDGVHQLAVDIELKLLGGRVADANGGRSRVALEVREHLLGQVGAPVDAVHDLERARGVFLAFAKTVGEPAHERLGLLGETEAQKRVADPGVAVVPVALAAELLGEARRGGGHERSGGPVAVAVPSSELRGTARVGRRTRADVRWELRQEAAGTWVAALGPRRLRRSTRPCAARRRRAALAHRSFRGGRWPPRVRTSSRSPEVRARRAVTRIEARPTVGASRL